MALQVVLAGTMLLEQPAAQIQADRWYPEETVAPVRPVPGAPSLIAFASFRDPRAFEGFGVLRRLAAKYAARGVTTTFVVRTQGYVGTQLSPPDSEAVRIREYFLSDLDLPVTLAVTLSKFERRSDGRRLLGQRTNEDAYRVSSRFGIHTYLVDSAGKIRWIADLSHASEPVFDDMIGELLKP
jgi:hypothetical protein